MIKKAILVTFLFTAIALGFSGGTGSPAEPYIITTASELDDINDNLSASYVLGSDIDLSSIVYNKAVVAHSAQFTGSFDGNGHTITGLTINASQANTGFIGQTSGAVITNVNIESAAVTSSWASNIAILCGYSFSSTVITNCSVSGSVNGGSCTGGLIGYNQISSVDNCSADCIVTSTADRTGVLIGYNFSNSPVSNSHSSGSVSGNSNVGGLIGMNQNTEIDNCFSTASVEGNNSTGGFIGYNQSATITNCYAQGDVTGKEYTGGFVGYNHGLSIDQCYASGSVEGTNYAGGFAGYSVTGDITECHAQGDVVSTGSSMYTGGFAGRNGSGTISYSYALGTASGYNYTGGFAGYNNNGQINVCFAEGEVTGANDYNGGLLGCNNSGSISNCYSWGDVTGQNYTAGFCGLSNSGSLSKSYCNGYVDGDGYYVGCFLAVTWSGRVSDCFWDTQTSGLGCPDKSGITGLSTAQMADQDNFTNAAWNFTDIWLMSPSGYPVHKWLDIEVPMLGSGTKDDPYQIATKGHLEQVNQDTQAYYILTEDISLSGASYTTAIISPDTDNSSYTFEGNIFLGSFDGNGHTISDITIDTQEQSNNYLGLFGSISRGSVKNVVLENISITAGSSSRYVGGLAGYNSSTTVDDSSVSGQITTGNDGSYYGGLIGRNGATITHCSSSVVMNAGESSKYTGGMIGYNYMTAKLIDCNTTGSVYAASGSESIGGLCGRNWFGAISDSYSSAQVQSSANTMYIGCLCGYNAGSITGSFSLGSVSTEGMYVGNLCGYNYYGTLINCFAGGNILEAGSFVAGLCSTNFKGVFIDCYASGQVNGSDNTGGLVADQTLAMTMGCFWDIEATGQDYSVAGTPKLTSQMQDVNTYLNAGWDFVNYWSLAPTEYPALVFPNIPIPNSPDLFSGGEGTLGNPYLIGTAADWQQLCATSQVWDKYFIVINDIDLKDVDIEPVGNSSTAFSGSFDGQEYTISNYSMLSIMDNQGLFGLTDGAEIKNVTVSNAEITGANKVALLIGQASSTVIENSHAQGDTAASGNDGGGLIGLALNTTQLSNCSVNAIVQVDGINAGILAGRVNNSTLTACSSDGQCFGGASCMASLAGVVENDSTVSECLAWGTVSAGSTAWAIGGLSGICDSSQVTNSFSLADVTGGNSVGGLIGEIVNSSLSACYSTGTVNTNTDGTTGGLIASTLASSVTNCFWDTEASMLSTSAAGIGLDTASMFAASTYLSAGWDFDNVWWLPTADYPKFKTVMKGSGTQTDPYIVENQYHLECINNSLSKTYYSLRADIDLSGTVYTAAVIASDNDIATSGFEGESFSGVFDGNGHKITGLKIDTSGEGKYYLGLFGRINGGSIRNLAVEDISITADGSSWYIGGISGWNNSVELKNCYTTGTIIAGEYSETIGGLCGENRGTVKECMTNITITAANNCKFIGALCGWNGGAGGGKKGDIRNCYATGEIAAEATTIRAGGMVGQNWYGTISDSYCETFASGGIDIGGFCGYNYNGTIDGCFWNSETTAIASSDGGSPLTTAQMNDSQIFIAAGWDYSSAWMQIIGEYPSLIFENTVSPESIEPLNAENIKLIAFIAENWLSPVGDAKIDLNQNSDDVLIDMNIFHSIQQ